MKACFGEGEQAPSDKNHHHYGSDLHDPQRLLAGLMNSLNIFPPEIHCYHDAKSRGKSIHRDVNRMTRSGAQVLNKAGHILSGGDCADGASENVIEKES